VNKRGRGGVSNRGRGGVPATRKPPPRRTATPGGMPWNNTGEKVRLITVSAAVIGAIYAGGYAMAQSGGILEFARPTSSIKLSLTPPARPGRFRDGTFSGTGSNMYGTVDVEIAIQSGRIGQVSITRCDTFFSQSFIDGLPALVVHAQSADVPVVSGATASWQDFVMAVQDALNQAVDKASGRQR
jgi:uncharacterized protein with FMN-binding domain